MLVVIGVLAFEVLAVVAIAVVVARVTEDDDKCTADDVVDSVTDVTCKEVYYVVEENSNKKLLISTLKV